MSTALASRRPWIPPFPCFSIFNLHDELWELTVSLLCRKPRAQAHFGSFRNDCSLLGREAENQEEREAQKSASIAYCEHLN
jgi:hypothetical protein